ncbi:MAG TPA: alpha/beta hydrolase [Ferrovibrio sp.]|jgi:arylformamidase|uniref:alpha/beta hydrolase n=1 Tax=Ferrovibrio sp. TaxID=1917215 RepID=UPI002ED2CCF4
MNGFNWRTLSADELEAQYNPRKSVPDFEQHFTAWVERSASARTRLPGAYDLRYGPGPLQTYDLHKPEGSATGRPLVVLIHGGYWRGLDKNTMTFTAEPFVAAGAVVVNLNYDLCPAVTLDAIVRQMQDALVHIVAKAADWGTSAARLHVIGHSAGAHLAAMMAAAPWAGDLGARPQIASLGLISGVFELEPVLHISPNQEIRLDSAMAVRNSVTRFAPKLAGPVLVAVGDDEPQAWQAQSVDFHQACRDAGTQAHLMRVANANHFNILYALADASKPLCTALLRQCGLK